MYVFNTQTHYTYCGLVYTIESKKKNRREKIEEREREREGRQPNEEYNKNKIKKSI